MRDKLTSTNPYVFKKYRQTPREYSALIFPFEEKKLVEKYEVAEDYEQAKVMSSEKIMINVVKDQDIEKEFADLLCRQLDMLHIELQDVTKHLKDTLDYLDLLDSGEIKL